MCHQLPYLTAEVVTSEECFPKLLQVGQLINFLRFQEVVMVKFLLHLPDGFSHLLPQSHGCALVEKKSKLEITKTFHSVACYTTVLPEPLGHRNDYW